MTRYKATAKHDNWLIYDIDDVYTYADIPKPASFLCDTIGKGHYYLKSVTSNVYTCIKDINSIKAENPFGNTNYKPEVLEKLLLEYYPEELI